MRLALLLFTVLSISLWSAPANLDVKNLSSEVMQLRSIVQYESVTTNSVDCSQDFLLFFYDRKARSKVEDWFDQTMPEILQKSGACHVHVLFAGGKSFLTPWRVLEGKIRSEVHRGRDRMNSKLNPEQKSILANIPTSFYLDRDRAFTSRYEAPRHTLAGASFSKGKVIGWFDDLLEDRVDFIKTLGD